EFYRFYAFFNNVIEKGLDGRTGNADPQLELPAAEQKAEIERLERETAALDKLVKPEAVAALVAEWEKTRLATLPEAPRRGLLAHYELDGTLADASGRYRHGKVVRGEVLYGTGSVARAAEINGETHVQLGEPADFEKDSPFSLALWVRASGTRAMTVLTKLADAGARRG